jgi:hypothetical protein
LNYSLNTEDEDFVDKESGSDVDLEYDSSAGSSSSGSDSDNDSDGSKSDSSDASGMFLFYSLCYHGRRLVDLIGFFANRKTKEEKISFVVQETHI